MLTLDSILNGLTEEQMDLVVGSRVQAGGNSCSYSKSHSKKSKKSKKSHRSHTSYCNPCYPCYPCYY
jgi:hypothetical protein